MADEITQVNKTDYAVVNGLPLPSAHTRRSLVVAVIIFSWTIIGFIVGWGDPVNSLHQSALSWAYSSMVAVIFAYVFGAVSDNYIVWKNKGL